MDETHLLYLTDSHAGSSQGVLAPNTKLPVNEPTGDEPATDYIQPLTDVQQTLWDHTQAILAQMETYTHGEPVHVLHGGEPVHGYKFTDSGDRAQQAEQFTIYKTWFAEIAARLPIASLWIAHGSDAHDNQGSGAESIAEWAREVYGIEAVSTRAARVTFDGCVIDLAHDGPTIGRSHTVGNPPRAYLRRAMAEDMDTLGVAPANVYLRGHVHGYCDVSDSIERVSHWFNSRLIVCPAMCGPNSYARKHTRGQAFWRSGMIYIRIYNGTIVQVEPMIQTHSSRANYTAGTIAHPFRNGERANREGS